MLKKEFLEKLRSELSGLPGQELEERLSFYSEMIDDRLEEGASEEDAVSGVGSIDDISAQIISDIPFSRIAKERIKSKRKMKSPEIVLLILGSPIWLTLVIAAFAVIFSLYISLWAVVVSLWAVFASLSACSVCSVPACIIFTAGGHGASGLALLAAGFVCAGLSIYMFFGCKASTDGLLTLTRKTAVRIKNFFIKKEETR